MADLGWLALLFPEKYGGDDGEFIEIALILEAMGAAIYPGPFFSTVVQCGLVLMEAGSKKQKKELISRIANGKLIVALA